MSKTLRRTELSIHIFDRISSGKKNYNQLHLKIGIVFLGALIIISSWAVTHHQLKKNQASLLLGLEREQKNLCSLLAENLHQILEETQTIAMLTLDRLNNKETSVNDITYYLYSESAFTRIVIYNLQGRILYRSSPRRQYSQDQTQLLKLIQQVISSNTPIFLNPAIQDTQTLWQIPLLFPLREKNFVSGVMLLELDIGYLLNLLRDINIGRTGRISLYNNQNYLLASFESGGLMTRQNQKKVCNHSWTEKDSGTTTFINSSGEPCQTAYRRISGYPFEVVVSQEVEDFLTDFHLYKKRLFGLLTVVTLFGSVGIYLLLKMIDRMVIYVHELAVSHKKNKRLLRKLQLEYQASKKAASVDTLTGLYNRRLFIHLAEKKLSAAKRNELTYAVLFLDLDRFKGINDTLGHHVGDLILQKVADRLHATTRESDVISRFGGDEFVVLLAEVSEEKIIVSIVEKIIRSISNPYEDVDGHRINTSPSIGIAVYPRDGNEIESLLVNADAAMYKSKKAGRGEYRFFEAALNTVSLQKFELEQRLPSAISGDEFICHYQPKIRLSDFRVTGLEALIRWQHPDHLLIYPNDFIEIAEESGLIATLGLWTLNRVCQQVITWLKESINLVPVALNVSPIELQNRNYAAQFIKTLEQYTVPPEYIEIEITESAFIEDRQVVVENLSILSQYGIKISLDDFGKGFATLDNVRSLPIDYLKIDRSFVKDIRNSSSDNSIVYSTIALAQKLNLEVIAEGVETNYQLRSLKLAGCDYVQGYYFSRPVSEEKIRAFLQSPKRQIVK